MVGFVSNTSARPSAEEERRRREIVNEITARETRRENSVSNAKSRGDVQYTLFASGLRNGRSNELESKDSISNLAILFDSVENHTYSKSYSKTSYAVESKVHASDHMTTQDGKFSFSGRITDSPYLIDKRNYIDVDTDPSRPRDSKRPQKAIEILEKIGDSHQLVTLVTEDNILTGYVITNLSFDRSASEGAGIQVSLDLEEFRFKTVGKTVLARTADPKKSGNANKGTKQTAAGGAADDDAKGKRKSPYLSKGKETLEEWEYRVAGTEDFSGKPGTKIKPTDKFDPGSLKR